MAKRQADWSQVQLIDGNTPRARAVRFGVKLASVAALGSSPHCPQERTSQDAITSPFGANCRHWVRALVVGQVSDIADEHRAVEAKQAIDPYTNKSETMTFNYCCFAIAPTTASWSRIQGGL